MCKIICKEYTSHFDLALGVCIGAFSLILMHNPALIGVPLVLAGVICLWVFITILSLNYLCIRDISLHAQNSRISN